MKFGVFRFAAGMALSLALAAPAALADNAGGPPGGGPPGNHPCKKVVAACNAAGYVRGAAKEGKGLFKDCVEPIRAGKQVAGVTVDPADVAACKAAPPPHKRPDAPPAP